MEVAWLGWEGKLYLLSNIDLIDRFGIFPALGMTGWRFDSNNKDTLTRTMILCILTTPRPLKSLGTSRFCLTTAILQPTCRYYHYPSHLTQLRPIFCLKEWYLVKVTNRSGSPVIGRHRNPTRQRTCSSNIRAHIPDFVAHLLGNENLD